MVKDFPPYDLDKLQKRARDLILSRGEIPTSLLIYKVMIIVRRQEIQNYIGGKK